jgi:hypothetical protein
MDGRWLRPVKKTLSKLRNRSPSPQPIQSAAIPSASHNAPNTSAAIPTSQVNSSIAASSVAASSATYVASGNNTPQANAYIAMSGLPTTVVIPETLAQRAKAEGSVAYEGLKVVLQGLSDCSGVFPPLKTAAAGLLTILNIANVCGSFMIQFVYITVLFLPSRKSQEITRISKPSKTS